MIYVRLLINERKANHTDLIGDGVGRTRRSNTFAQIRFEACSSLPDFARFFSRKAAQNIAPDS